MALGSHLITVRRLEKYINDVIGKKANLPDTNKTIIGNISQINSDLSAKLTNDYRNNSNVRKGITFDNNADGSHFTFRPVLSQNLLQITKNDTTSLLDIYSNGQVKSGYFAPRIWRGQLGADTDWGYSQQTNFPAYMIINPRLNGNYDIHIEVRSETPSNLYPASGNKVFTYKPILATMGKTSISWDFQKTIVSLVGYTDSTAFQNIMNNTLGRTGLMAYTTSDSCFAFGRFWNNNWDFGTFGFEEKNLYAYGNTFVIDIYDAVIN